MIQAMFSNWRIISADFDFAVYRDYSFWSAGLFMFFMTLIFTLILLSILVAIIIEVYVDVKTQKTKIGAETLWSQSNESLGRYSNWILVIATVIDGFNL